MLKNYYICTIDGRPCEFADHQFVFARDGVALRAIAYKDLKTLRKKIKESETWRKKQGYGIRDRIDYWRIKL